MHVLGVDGGNTKTVALVAREDGSVAGAAVGSCADIYNAASAEDALAEIRRTARHAVAEAGIEPDALDSAAFSLAGADWPEDHELLRTELRQRLDLGRAPVVVNDALGGLWAGAPDGVGVAVVCGTAGAVGAGGRGGQVWHASFWLGSSGGIELVRQALRATYRSALAIDPPTSLTAALLAFFDAPTPEALLHRLTRRERGIGWNDVARAAPAVLDAADGGDETARRLVAGCGAQLGDFALVAAREVGLDDGQPFPLVLSGGVLRHPSALLVGAIVDRVAAGTPAAHPVRADLPPAAGAVLIALREAGVVPHQVMADRLRSTLPAAARPMVATGGR